jgi:sulfite exporter TauE/SafE
MAVARKEGPVGVVDVVIFLMAKLVAYVILGMGLGLLGSAFKLTPAITAGLQITAGLFMAGVGMAMLEVHPFFRRFLLQTPRWVGRYVRQTAKNGDKFAPVVLGASTVFLPCGTTQAMMALAVTSASPWKGAAVLGTFVVGTGPVFMGLGLALVKLGELVKNRFRKIAAAVVLVMGLFSLNSGLVVGGSPVTVQKVWAKIECGISDCPSRETTNPTDEVTITILSNKYEVDKPVVKAGSQVKLKIVNKGGFGCIQAVNFPSLGLTKIVAPGQSEQMEVTIPKQAGELAFSCSMGMYTGHLTVVN